MRSSSIEIHSGSPIIEITSNCPSCKKSKLITHKQSFGMGVEFICDGCYSVFELTIKRIPDKEINKQELKEYRKKREVQKTSLREKGFAVD